MQRCAGGSDHCQRSDAAGGPTPRPTDVKQPRIAVDVNPAMSFVVVTRLSPWVLWDSSSREFREASAGSRNDWLTPISVSPHRYPGTLQPVQHTLPVRLTSQPGTMQRQRIGFHDIEQYRSLADFGVNEVRPGEWVSVLTPAQPLRADLPGETSLPSSSQRAAPPRTPVETG